MSKKEIRFSSVIDTKEFDKSIAAMQEKLQKVYQNSDRSRAQLDLKQATSRVGLGAAPTTGDKVRADNEDKKTRRELDGFIKDQLKSQEALGKTIAKQIEQRKELSKIAKDDIKSQEKALELEKQIATNREKMKASEEVTRRALNDRSRPGFDGVGGFGGAFQRGVGAYQGAGVGGAGMFGQIGAGATGFARGVAGMGLAGVGGILGAAGTGLSIYGAVDERFNLSNRQILSAQGTARSGLGQNVRDIFNRNGMEQSIYAPETAKSMNDAEEEIKRTKRNDLIKLGGAAIGLVGGALLSLTGVGAAAGVPAMLSGGAAIAGGIGLLSQGDKAMDMVTGKYGADMEAKRVGAYQQNLEARKNLDPVKRAALERYQQEMMPNLMTQRATGMDDSQLKESLLGGTAAGFTTDMTRESMGGILAAGGSTRGARGNATFANQLSRNFDLTNASSAMGRLSSLTGDSSQSENSMLRILSQAMSLGLDDSQFAEEQRRFVDASTEIIQRSGALTSQGQGAVSAGFSQFLSQGKVGMADIRGARQAYEVTNALTGEGGGARGTIQAAGLMKDKDLSKLNQDQKSMLLQLTDEQLSAGGPMIEGMAASAGLSVEEFTEKARAVKKNAVSSRADVDDQASVLKKLKAEGKEGSAEYKIAESKYLSGMGYDVAGIAKMDPSAQKAFIKGNVFGEKLTEQETQALSADAKSRSQLSGTREGDMAVAGQAAGDSAFLETMGLFSGEVKNANTNLITFSKEITEATAKLRTISETDTEGLAKGYKAIAEIFAKMGVAAPQGKDLIQPKGGPANGK